MQGTTYWRRLVILNTTYWYLWALFTPAIIWLSQHFRFERQGLWRAVLVHLPSVVLFSLTHILTMSGVQWWFARAQGRPFAWADEAQKSALLNFDWEMMTYWTIVGLSHAVLYYRESKDRALRTSQLETRLVEAQLKTLQQQLHPHFLFNTLHAISALMHRDVEAADRTLMRLSDLLRLTLENIGQQEIPLQAELDFLSKYLQIEQTRFADRLVVRFDVQPETLDTLRAQPHPAAARRERDQARRGQEERARTHRHLGPARGRQAAHGSPRRRGGAVGGRADGAAERHRRVDHPRAAAAPLRRRLPVRVPPPAVGAVGRRGHSLADRGQDAWPNRPAAPAEHIMEMPRVAAAGRLATARQHQ